MSVRDTTQATQVTYTPAQAAARLGLTEGAIRARIFRKQLPARRWGRRILIRHEDLMAVVQGR